MQRRQLVGVLHARLSVFVGYNLGRLGLVQDIGVGRLQYRTNRTAYGLNDIGRQRMRLRQQRIMVLNDPLGCIPVHVQTRLILQRNIGL